MAEACFLCYRHPPTTFTGDTDLDFGRLKSATPQFVSGEGERERGARHCKLRRWRCVILFPKQLPSGALEPIRPY